MTKLLLSELSEEKIYALTRDELLDYSIELLNLRMYLVNDFNKIEYCIQGNDAYHICDLTEHLLAIRSILITKVPSPMNQLKSLVDQINHLRMTATHGIIKTQKNGLGRCNTCRKIISSKKMFEIKLTLADF